MGFSDWLDSIKQQALATQPGYQLLKQVQASADLQHNASPEASNYFKQAYQQYQAQGGKSSFDQFIFDNGTALQAQYQIDATKQANDAEGKQKDAETQRAKEAPFNAAFDQQNAQIQAFIDRLSKPLFDANGNPADAEVAHVMAAGRNVGQQEANNRGIEGGLSVGNTQRAAMAATNPLAQFRQGLAAQAMGQQQSLLGMRSNRDINLSQLAQNNNQFMQGLGEHKFEFDANQRAQQYASQQQQGSGLGSLLGGAAGLAASFIPGLQPLAPALIAGGSAIGGGIGGTAAGTYQPMSRGGYQWGR